MLQSGVARTDSLAVAFPCPPFLPQVYQSVRDAFVGLEMRGGHVYNRREEDVKQEGREHAPLTKTLFHSKPPRAHPVVEPHACSHATVELTDDRDNILWHAKTGEYCPEEGSINGVVRFGKIDKAYIQWNSFLWQDPLAPTVLAEAASDDLQKYLAGVRCQRDAPVLAALCPILVIVEYHDDGIFPLLRHLAPRPNTNDDIEQSPPQGGITVEGDLEQLNGDSVRSDSLSVRQRADGVCQLLHRGLNS